jgi:two-component system NtrC family response regulator
VGELPLSMQKTFLRVLEEKRFRPLGGKEEIRCDFRLIAATNRNLDQMVRLGVFREDLLFRICQKTLHLPPLRDRKDDIIEMALHYLSQQCEKQSVEIKKLSPEFADALITYSWPGNVRELFTVLDNALSAAGNAPVLFPIHLSKPLRMELARKQIKGKPEVAVITENSVTSRNQESHSSFSNLTYQQYRDQCEKKYFLDLIAYTNGNISKACRLAHLSRASFYRFINKLGIAKGSAH